MAAESAVSQTYIEDVREGMALPELVKRPTHTMLFRFSAVTWNAHRIHYDQAYARTENHPDVLVQATMHGAFLLAALGRFAGPAGRVIRFKYANRGKGIPGDVLVCGGRVVAIDAENAEVECEIWERNQNGDVCAPGNARVKLPRRS